jgi:glycogen synthase
MRTAFAQYFKTAGSVFTIHNIGYQGEYPAEWLEDINRVFGIDRWLIEKLMIKNGQLNFMAVVPGIILWLAGVYDNGGSLNEWSVGNERGNYINTVSLGYAADTRKTNFEMDMLLQRVGHRYGGIQNGIDFEVWNPSKDRQIKHNYSIDNGIASVRSARLANKQMVRHVLSDMELLKQELGFDPSRVHGRLEYDPN